jgi:hypothetical protein
MGPRGGPGPAGRDGKDGHTVVLKTKKWEISTEDYLAREILSDGSRMPALNLRPMLERLMPEIDLRVQSMVEQVIAEAIRPACCGQMRDEERRARLLQG